MFQATQDLIRSLHETSLLLQERMAISEMESYRKHQEKLSRAQHYKGFARSPSKRGPRVSARFKRMSASPTKFTSPCRKGIKGLRIAAPSPLIEGTSPSQNMSFEASPGAGLKRSAPPDDTSPSKKNCVDEETVNDENKNPEISHDKSGTSEQSANKKPRRSELARRVSLRLKQVYGKSPVRSRTPRKRRSEIALKEN